MSRFGSALPGLYFTRLPPDAAGIVGQNIRSLSEAFLYIERRFFLSNSRNALDQTITSLKLSRVSSGINSGKPDALLEFKGRIDKLSANGPPAHRNET